MGSWVMRQSVKIVVRGKVQGVSYRDFVKKEAEKLKVEGTAQNAPDGSVVIYASATSDSLDSFIDFLYKGSSKSEVEDVLVEPLVRGRDFRNVFRIIGVHH
jgi:acylphosphatase